LKAEFSLDFRTHDWNPEFLLPVGQGDLLRDEKGLSISCPAGRQKLRQDTGLYTEFSIRGDFEVMVSFEILKADRPSAGTGVGPVLVASDQYGANAVSLACRLLPDGKTMFLSDRSQRVQGKATHKVNSLPSAAMTGKLRLERRGALVRCRICEGDNPEFVTVAELPFGRADVHTISVCGSTGESDSGLELRLLEFTVRAEAFPGLSEPPAAAAGIQRLDAGQSAELEAKLQKLYGRLAPSVVRIVNPRRAEGGFSGVIVSPAGEILTCAHHHLPPKTKVVVELADGRKVQGTILGSVEQTAGGASRYPAADVGMVALDDKRDWPAATLGRSGMMKAGDFCLALGQPNVHQAGQPPLLRLGRILAPNPLGRIRTTCRIQPGDSGGPLFDLSGRVLGVHQAMESLKRGITLHSPIEGFLKVRDRLRAGERVVFEKELPEQTERRKEPWGAWEPTAAFSRSLGAAHKSTVEVLGDGKVIALGVIVDEAGWILTKRTELWGPGGQRRLVCRLAGGARLAATVMGQSREHDLALLKVPATGLPAVRWGKSGGLRVGQLIASLGTGPEPLHCGAVGALHTRNPGSKGYLPIRVGAAAEGVRGAVFTGFLPAHRQVDEARTLLKPGDLISHLDDLPTTSEADFARVRDRRTAAADALAGEWMKLTVQRGGKSRQVFLPLTDGAVLFPTVWTAARWNVRRSGFPNVFCHDGGIAADRCGGPVVDRSGQVIGINIARPDPMRTFAIPSDVVQTEIAELKAKAQKNE
jgi:serine protease Do